ncbi:hypothetical protein EYF80_031239 [Liparis tanakae]|uniref:Uncharacterized protein n=1 Tax=Liparis tanakae TaxID=230148 RepID=A0A4Z2GYT5_9TELE|nr:hypothetical protein EYF80_031239 [Liparis tanakae]
MDGVPWHVAGAGQPLGPSATRPLSRSASWPVAAEAEPSHAPAHSALNSSLPARLATTAQSASGLLPAARGSNDVPRCGVPTSDPSFPDRSP